MPKFINLRQRSPEWHAWRKNKVTASMAATVMQQSPYETALQLYTRLLEGVESPSNDAMERGVTLEPDARKWAENSLGFDFPESCAEDDEFSWLAASLDGYNRGKNIAIEIKCMGKKGHHEAKLGIVKPFYMPQLQCQMRAYNLDWMYYIAYDPDEGGEIIKVQRDDLFIEKMLPMLADFRQRLISFDPPNPTDKDLMEINDALATFRAGEIFNLMKEKDRIEKELEMNREYLKVLCEGKSCKIGDYRFVKFSRKGNIDTQKISEEYSIDLEKYRKPRFEQWRFS